MTVLLLLSPFYYQQTSSKLANSAYQSTAPSSAYAVKPNANVSFLLTSPLNVPSSY